MLRQRALLSLPSRALPRALPLRNTRPLHIRTSPFAQALRPTYQPQITASTLAQFRHASSSSVVPRERPRMVRYLYKTFAFVGFAGMTVTGLVVAFFLYDASTYKEEGDKSDVSVSDLALNPKRGGPKNLPIAELLVDDEDNDENRKKLDKPRLVILGCGWGSVGMLKNINPDHYHITVVSPSNYFLFTPLLPSATVGTLEVRSLMEPIRRITGAVKGHFLKANAEDVEFSEKLVELSQTLPNGEKRNFYLPYDKLVIAVGSTTRTHGVEGLEHVNYLKNVQDARLIRSKVIENFERACLPTTTDEERRKLLSFVVCGGGPTGVEFAAELFDMLNEDMPLRYPKILRNEISVHIVQSRSHILNTYEETLSKFAEDRFARDDINVLTNARVSRITPDTVVFTQLDPETKETLVKELPFGLCLWSTGVAQTTFANRIAARLGAAQTNNHALETDPHLRLVGTPLSDVYAIGDCATVQNHITDHILAFLKQVAWENNIQDPKALQLDFAAWRTVARRIKSRFPQTSDHLRRIDKLFESYDKDQSGTLDFTELTTLLTEIDHKLTSLPATAQRANQQGLYLARKFNKLAQAAPGLQINHVINGDLDATVYKAFEYKHLGSLAYIGNAAIFDYNGYSMGGGLVYLYLWRGVYFAQSVGFRTRCMLAMDWTRRALFGRDLVNF